MGALKLGGQGRDSFAKGPTVHEQFRSFANDILGVLYMCQRYPLCREYCSDDETLVQYTKQMMRFVTAEYRLKLITNQLCDKQMCSCENTSYTSHI